MKRRAPLERANTSESSGEALEALRKRLQALWLILRNFLPI
jgi:hypothetical protein